MFSICRIRGNYFVRGYSVTWSGRLERLYVGVFCCLSLRCTISGVLVIENEIGSGFWEVGGRGSFSTGRCWAEYFFFYL